MPVSKTHGPEEKTLTIIVHGTFARDETWWRPGQGGRKTFADHLEQVLSERGLSGTVWKPATDNGYGLEDFSWSGNNKHKDRVSGARKIAGTLNGLADKMETPAHGRLRLNIIAHSHGGNVVLNMLRRLGENIDVNRIILLGTPLIVFKPALRILRLLIAYLMLLLLTIFGFYLLFQVFHFLFTLGSFFDAASQPGEEGIPGSVMVFIIVPVIALYGWLFWGLAWIGDGIWKILISPFLWLGRKRTRRAYGPPEQVLDNRLINKPVVLFTSHHDEADVLLQLGSAPKRLYKDFMKDKNRVIKVLELILIRPVIMDLFFEVLEVVLEYLALGFSAVQVLFFNHEMASIDEQPYYPRTILKRVDVTNELLPSLKTMAPILITSGYMSDENTTESSSRRAKALLTTLKEIAGNLQKQIKLRHSLYYQSKEVLARIADLLAADAKKQPAGKEL